MNKTKPTLGSLWRTRNGCEARITSIDNGGMRPVSASVQERGQMLPHIRYYTAKGFEEIAPRGKKQPVNPYDLVAKLMS